MKRVKNNFPSRIYLIGFMGSGKSTLGKEVAKKIGYEFFDTDDAMEKKLKMKIKNIIEKKGMDFFKEAEKEIFYETFSLEKTVIATGGGLPVYEDNITKMKQRGMVIWLKPSVKELCKRLQKHKSGRPLIANIPMADLPFFIEMLLQRRIKFYRRAHAIIESDKISAEKIKREIKKFYKR